MVCRASGQRSFWSYFGAFRRTPGPPPLCGMNTRLAASKARRMASMFWRISLRRPEGRARCRRPRLSGAGRRAGRRRHPCSAHSRRRAVAGHDRTRSARLQQGGTRGHRRLRTVLREGHPAAGIAVGAGHAAVVLTVLIVHRLDGPVAGLTPRKARQAVRRRVGLIRGAPLGVSAGVTVPAGADNALAAVPSLWPSPPRPSRSLRPSLAKEADAELIALGSEQHAAMCMRRYGSRPPWRSVSRITSGRSPSFWMRSMQCRLR